MAWAALVRFPENSLTVPAAVESRHGELNLAPRGSPSCTSVRPRSHSATRESIHKADRLRASTCSPLSPRHCAELPARERRYLLEKGFQAARHRHASSRPSKRPRVPSKLPGYGGRIGRLTEKAQAAVNTITASPGLMIWSYHPDPTRDRRHHTSKTRAGGSSRARQPTHQDDSLKALA